MANRNAEKYDRSVETKREARIKKLCLREIAAMLRQGERQTDIARKLNKSTSTICENIKILKEEFPEIYSENSENFSEKPNSENSETKNRISEQENSENSENEIRIFRKKLENSENSEIKTEFPNSEIRKIRNNDNVNDNDNKWLFEF